MVLIPSIFLLFVVCASLHVTNIPLSDSTKFLVRVEKTTTLQLYDVRDPVVFALNTSDGSASACSTVNAELSSHTIWRQEVDLDSVNGTMSFEDYFYVLTNSSELLIFRFNFPAENAALLGSVGKISSVVGPITSFMIEFDVQRRGILIAANNRLLTYYNRDSNTPSNWVYLELGRIPNGCYSMEYVFGYLLIACGPSVYSFDLRGSNGHMVQHPAPSNSTKLTKLMVHSTNSTRVFGVDANSGLIELSFSSGSITWSGLVLPRRGLIDIVTVPNEEILWLLVRNEETAVMTALEVYLKSEGLALNRAVELKGEFSSLRSDDKYCYVVGPKGLVMIRHGIPSDGVPYTDGIRSDLSFVGLRDVGSGVSRGKMGDVRMRYLVSITQQVVALNAIEERQPVLSCRLDYEGTTRVAVGIFSQTCDEATGELRKDNICMYDHSVEVVATKPPLLTDDKAFVVGLGVGLPFMLLVIGIGLYLRRTFKQQMEKLSDEYNRLVTQPPNAESNGDLPVIEEINSDNSPSKHNLPGNRQNFDGDFAIDEVHEGRRDADGLQGEQSNEEEHKGLEFDPHSLEGFDSIRKYGPENFYAQEGEGEADPPIIEHRHSDSVLAREAAALDRRSFTANRDSEEEESLNEDDD